MYKDCHSIIPIMVVLMAIMVSLMAIMVALILIMVSEVLIMGRREPIMVGFLNKKSHQWVFLVGKMNV